MSGPKVVRIVTREEIIDLCRALLSVLDSALEEWERIGRRNNTVTQDDIAAFKQRRAAIHTLIGQDRLTELQKAVPEEIAFLTADQESRIQQASAIRAAERTKRRRTGAAAQSVLNRLIDLGLEVPAELCSRLEAVVGGGIEDAGAITLGFSILAERKQNQGVTEHQLQLAEKLRDGPERQTIDQWIASESQGDEDAVRIERRLAELYAILGDPVTGAFETRLRALASEAPHRRRLVADTLEVDISKAVARAREGMALEGRLRGLAADLAGTGVQNLAALASELLQSLGSEHQTLAALEARALAARDLHRAQLAAHARREAVLSSLASLGYQVSGEIETAWVENGSVVLRKPSHPGYGVEIGGGANAARLQVRVVAFRSAAEAPDRARDVDAESLWCSEFSKLMADFALSGNSIEIERAMPVGATPLKTIKEAPSVETQHRSESRPLGWQHRRGQ